MREERMTAEKRFWEAISCLAIESGLEPSWEYLGYSCPRNRMNELIARFHKDAAFPGFYGLKIPLGEFNGLIMNLIVENQRELVIGLQADEAESETGGSMDSIRELMDRLNHTGRAWDFDAPGWVAWKTTDVRLNFRSMFNRAFQDMVSGKSDSEALCLISGELADIMGEIRGFATAKAPEYGTVIN